MGQELEICETRGTYAEPNVKGLTDQVSAHLKKAELRQRQRSRKEP